jgi:hypothetical protein
MEVPEALGVDDFALHRGKAYGTILVNLPAHSPIEVLLERTTETLSRWLAVCRREGSTHRHEAVTCLALMDRVRGSKR